MNNTLQSALIHGTLPFSPQSSCRSVVLVQGIELGIVKVPLHTIYLHSNIVTLWANWHAIIASSCRWSQREYKRQQVHCINHAFAEEPSRWPGRSAVVQQLWRRDVTSPFPSSGNEGYIRNRDVPFQSVTPSHVGWPTKLGSLPKRHKSCPFQHPV